MVLYELQQMKNAGLNRAYKKYIILISQKFLLSTNANKHNRKTLGSYLYTWNVDKLNLTNKINSYAGLEKIVISSE